MQDNLLSLKIKSLNLNLLRALGARYKKMNLGVTPVQGRIIMFIDDHDDEVCQKDIERMIACKKSTLSAILNSMEKNKLIIRKGSNTDSRRNSIVLTAYSIEIANKLKEDMKEINKLLGENITKDEYIIFSDVLEKINQNIERI